MIQQITKLREPVPVPLLPPGETQFFVTEHFPRSDREIIFSADDDGCDRTTTRCRTFELDGRPAKARVLVWDGGEVIGANIVSWEYVRPEDRIHVSQSKLTPFLEERVERDVAMQL